MLKYFAIALLTFACLSLTACQRDSDVEKFITDLDSATKDIVKAVDDSPNVAGVDAAQKIFDEKKGGLKAHLDSLKTARASNEMTEKLKNSVTKNVADVFGLQSKYIQESLRDEDFQTKLKKLGDDYVNLLKMQ